MQTQSGALSFSAIIQDVNFRSQLDAMERRVLGFSGNVVRETSKIDDSFRRLGQLAAGYFSFQALSDLPAQILEVRGSFQALEIAFTTMLRSKSKADAFLKEGVEFAATSPFSLKDIGQGQKQLLAYGFSVNEIIPALKRLGDISAGLGLPLERLTYLYGTTKTQGRLFAQDLNQFVGSGIPLISELSKQFGVTEDKIRGLVEEGKVGFDSVKKAIEGMTSGSGIFTGTVDAQSKSILGLKEKLGDAYEAVLNDIGKKNEGVITDLLNTATEVVTHYQDIIDILKVVVTVYGSYRAALLLVSTAQRANLIFTQTMAVQQGLAALSGTTLTTAQLRLAASTSLLSRAQAALNTTMLANPYVLVGTALAALVTYIVLYKDETEKLKTSQEILAGANKEALSNFNKQRGEIGTLIGVIQNQNVAESERLKAYNRLKEIAPDITAGLDFQRAKTADLTKAVNDYIGALRKRLQLESGQNKAKDAYDQQTEAVERLKKAEDDLIASRGKKESRVVVGVGMNGPVFAKTGAEQAQANYEDAIKFKKKADQVVAEVEQTLSSIYAGTNTKAELEANIAQQERVMASLDKLSFGYKIAEFNLNKYKEELAKVNAAEKVTQAVQGKTIEQLNEEIKLKKESLNTANSDAKNAKINQEIDKLEAQRRKLTGDRTAAEKKAARDADKVGPYGSVTYWENIIKKVEEVLGKTPKDNTGIINKQNQIKLNAETQLESARKAIALKSFDEELSEKRDKYTLYQKWVDAYGKQAADVQFGELVKSGQSFVDYLNAQIAQLEDQKENVGLTDKEAMNLSSLLDSRNEATGKKSAMDVFAESLQKAQREAASLTDYLETLKEKQAELNPNDNSPTGVSKRKTLADEMVGTENELRSRLREFLSQMSGSEDQLLAIQRNYADLRAGLDKQYTDKRSVAYKSALAQINAAEKGELQQFQQSKLEQTEEYRKLTRVITEEGNKGLRIEIANLEAYAQRVKTTLGATSEEYKKVQKEISQKKTQLSEGVLSNINQFAGLANQLGQALIEMGGDAAKGGQALVSLANSVPLLASAFKSGITDVEKYSIAIQGAINLFTSITAAAAQRKKAESDYYASLIAQQQQYNLLLNEQLGTQSKSKENIFVKNYLGELNDAFNKFDDAQLKYQESLKKLNEGRAKAGLANSFDASNFLSTVGAGAAIGSVIPGIGTAVGAVAGAIVGGIVGLFSSNKKVDEFGNLLALYPNLIQKSKDGVDELNVSLAESLVAQGLVDDKTKELLQSTIDWQKQIDAAREAVKAILSDLVGALGDKLRDNLVGAFRDGTDAAFAFKSAVSGILEDLVTKMLFSQAFNGLFTKLQDDLSKSLDVQSGGDGNTIDDFERFTENSKDALAQYNQWLQQFQDAAKKSGFDVLSPSSASTSGNSIQGAIKGITEETAGILAGQFNAIRITQADTNATIRQSLFFLSGIEQNTNRTAENTKYLENIDRSLSILANDPLRGVGGVPR